ncbi:MAG: PilZ domain-containing protein [Sandaracinaceae bacterium]|nr:PilZ domain-containing protein [Sandaracinaceae bacterium]
MEGRVNERRDHVDLSATATLLQRGEAVGRFTVQNLSAGGALLTGGHDVARAAPLRLLLELPGGETLAVGAHVRRRARAGDTVALAVAFRHLDPGSEDRIQDAVVRLLDDHRRAEHPPVVVLDTDETVRLELMAHVAALGRRPVPCAAPLDAIRVLESDERVEAVVAREGGGGLELLAWVADNHPESKAILLVEDRASDPAVGHLRVVRCFPEHLSSVLA